MNQNVKFTREDKTELATVPRVACERLQTAVTKIQREANYSVDRVLISNIEDVNAFATLDKNNRPAVIVNIGMLKTLSADEDAWAGLLGHEIAHLVKRHREGRDDAKAGAQTSGQAVGNVVAQLIPGVGGFVAGNAASFATANALYGAYTRPQEREADELGLKWMVAAGYDPHGMERLFDVLAKQSTGGLPGFLSTHPGAEDRAQMVRDFIARSAPTPVAKPAQAGNPQREYLPSPSTVPLNRYAVAPSSCAEVLKRVNVDCGSDRGATNECQSSLSGILSAQCRNNGSRHPCRAAVQSLPDYCNPGARWYRGTKFCEAAIGAVQTHCDD